jgi:hypothetical protein
MDRSKREQAARFYDARISGKYRPTVKLASRIEDAFQNRRIEDVIDEDAILKVTIQIILLLDDNDCTVTSCTQFGGRKDDLRWNL